MIDLVNDKTRLDKIIYGSSGVVTDYSYNDNGRLESIAVNKDAGVLLSRDYHSTMSATSSRWPARPGRLFMPMTTSTS